MKVPLLLAKRQKDLNFSVSELSKFTRVERSAIYRYLKGNYPVSQHHAVLIASSLFPKRIEWFIKVCEEDRNNVTHEKNSFRKIDKEMKYLRGKYYAYFVESVDENYNKTFSVHVYAYAPPNREGDFDGEDIQLFTINSKNGLQFPLSMEITTTKEFLFYFPYSEGSMLNIDDALERYYKLLSELSLTKYPHSLLRLAQIELACSFDPDNLDSNVHLSDIEEWHTSISNILANKSHKILKTDMEKLAKMKILLSTLLRQPVQRQPLSEKLEQHISDLLKRVS